MEEDYNFLWLELHIASFTEIMIATSNRTELKRHVASSMYLLVTEPGYAVLSWTLWEDLRAPPWRDPVGFEPWLTLLSQDKIHYTHTLIHPGCRVICHEFIIKLHFTLNRDNPDICFSLNLLSLFASLFFSDPVFVSCMVHFYYTSTSVYCLDICKYSCTHTYTMYNSHILLHSKSHTTEWYIPLLAAIFGWL